MIPQENFEKLSRMMADYGVPHEAFEILADIRASEIKYYELYKIYQQNILLQK